MSDTISRVIGRVKWFNNKVGYGFVTVSQGEYANKDIFAHHSVISVADQQYRYLVQGEYVEIEVSPVSGGKYEYQATSVSGINGGLLMCETRNESKQARTDYISKKTGDRSPTIKQRAVRRRGGGPRDESVSNEESV